MYESIKYIKLQADVMKAYDKKMYGSAFDWKYVKFETYDQKSQGITNGKFIMFIPEDMFLLDRDKVFAPNTIDGNRLIDAAIKNSYKAFNTGIVMDKFINSKKIKLREIKVDNPEGDVTFLDDTLASKYFDLSVCSLKTTDKKAPVLLYEGDILTAVIMPVNAGN